MASNWIPTGNDQARLQGLARTFIQSVITAWEVGPVLNNTLAQMLGGGTDYSTIESYFGVPTGQGVTFKALLGSANADVQASANVAAMVQRLT